MDPENEEGVLSILRGRKGCDDIYDSISEFIEDLGVEVEELANKWDSCVLSEKHQQQQQQISTLLLELKSEYYSLESYLMQFWGVEEVEGSHHHLSTKHHPFCARYPNKGICWYRKLCRNHKYDVDVEGGDDDYEEQLGGVGRAYRNKQPESTPDLRLYSTHQFPMRDQAARCGFRGYAALPIFDSATNHCYGVLEVLVRFYYESTIIEVLPQLDEPLEKAGLKSTHRLVPTSDFRAKWLQLPEIEIREMLELAVATVPRLYLAQVWVPSHQCTTNSCCMELEYFINSPQNEFNSYKGLCDDMARYIGACALHKLHLYHRCFSSSNLGDVSISKNPLAHYAQRARISRPFAVSLQSQKDSNHSYLIQFFVQPKFREDGYGDNSLHLLLRIMEINLKSFDFELLGQFLEECQKPNAIEFESTDSLEVIKSYKQELSESKDSEEEEDSEEGDSEEEEDSEEGEDSELGERLLVHTSIKKKIEDFMQKVDRYFDWGKEYWIVQFWAPEMMENRCYLETSDQPYAVYYLTNELAYFREKCRTHHYFVDDEAKEEELGPPGRVYKNRHPEITPDFFHYTTKEFPIKKYAMRCCSRPYLALPIFVDQHSHCVGVLEFLGLTYHYLHDIRNKLEEVKLSSSPTCFHPRLLADEEPDNSINCRGAALKEVEDTLRLICDDIPQYYMANVWVPNEECVIGTDGNMICMELAYNTEGMERIDMVHSRKGVVGMVLESENRSCFCRNLSKFSIADQPLSHFEMSKRCDACFAICLQSAHTGNLVYILEFYLYSAPASYEYLRSFLNFLLPLMKDELTSFKMACGKQLGEELVVEVIEFSEENKLGPSESVQPDVFPIKFKSVQYTQKGHQCIEEQQTEQHIFEEQQTEEHIFEEQQTEEHIVVASDLKRREGGKRKTGLHLNLEILRPHFGKKLKDVSIELGVGRSTIKRACREYGIDRWPGKQKYNKNPLLFERESGMDSQQDTLPSTSNIQPLDASLNQNVRHANTESVEKKVIIKVEYKEDIIKFESCLSLGLAKLVEKVATDLNLEKGTFKLKYLDEDGDEILLNTDDSLQLCQKNHIAMGKTFIKLLVR